jgi:hypothetical protein
VLAALVQPAPAAAIGPCEARAQRAPAPHPGPAPLAIGDSVMLGAADALARAGFRVNARGCRQMTAGLQLLERRRSFPPAVILSLGTNADVSGAQISRALDVIGSRSTLVLVTPANGGRDPQLMRRAARRRERVCVADWARRVHAHPEYAPGDGLHLSAAGIRAYVRLLKPYRRISARRPGACARRSDRRRSRRPRD